MYTNLATGQTLNTCDFFAYISSINWCSCTTDEVWLGNGVAKSGYDWFMYFQSNTPTCANQAPTCMAVHISDADQPGETISVLNFPAIGIPTPTKTYLWESSVDGITWVSTGITGASFVIAPTDVGKYIRVKGTATNGIGSPSVCYSGAVPIVPSNASPTNTIAPVISGSTTQGSVLTCTTGTWSGYPAPSFTFAWFANGQQVGTGNTYTLNLSDSLKNITCVVTANNGINPNGTATSNTITAGDYSPQNLTTPTISGGTSLGSQLTCSVGTWSGTNITYNYQWFSGATPVGDNSAQYQLQLTDTLANITCVVTAVNPAGSNSATSNTITAGDFSPVNSVLPNIYVLGGGLPNPGATLECNKGVWIGNNLTYIYEWYAGATLLGTGTTFLITNANAGQSITCVVTATNLGGSTQATSNAIVIPSGPSVTPPSNVTTPTISVASGGSVLAGKSLVVNIGVWLGTAPIIYTYEWFVGLISVGTGISYNIQVADIGQTIKCVVTATNAYGTASANSNTLTPTGQVNTPPSSVLAPTIYVANGGSALAGKALACDIGAWDGTSPITYSYQWYSNAVPVGIDDPSYLMQSSDIGNNITCVVTATNAIGTANATSNAIAVIGTIYTAPVNIVLPSISTCGFAIVGTCLSSNIGTWDGDDITYSFEWYSGVTMVATTENYQLQASDFGNPISLKVTATNIYGTAVAVSASVTCVDIPKNTVTPSISGTLVIGNVLTCSTGTWIGNTPITYAYQWFRNGQVISGETNNTYTSVTSDIGQNITCLVSATNTYGTGAQVTTSAVVVTSSPILIQAPVIYGIYLEGSILSVQNGYYQAQPSATITRKWQYSTDSGSTWNDYSPAQTGTTYTIQTGEAGRQIRVLETASNGIGSPLVTASNVAQIQSVGVGGGPVISGTPLVTGIEIVSQTLTCSIAPLTITGSPTPTITYQWYDELNIIAGATSSTYTLQTTNSGDKVWCRVTASNVNGTSYVDSNKISVFLTLADKYPGGWHSGWYPYLLQGSYYGQPLIRIRRESDNAEIDITHDNNGYINESAITAHCTGTNGRVVQVYDQFGTNHMVQTTQASQPLIFSSSTGLVKENGIVVINNNAVTGQNLFVANSQTSGVYNFLHNGTQAVYSVLAVSKSVNSVAQILANASTSATTTGLLFAFGSSWAGRVQVSNGTAIVITNNTTANFVPATKTNVMAIVNRVNNASATLRTRYYANNFVGALNNATNAPTTNNPTFNLTWGGSAVYPHLGLFILQNETYIDQLREAMRIQFNITY